MVRQQQKQQELKKPALIIAPVGAEFDNRTKSPTARHDLTNWLEHGILVERSIKTEPP